MSDTVDRDEGDIKDPPARKKPAAADVHDEGGEGEKEEELEVVDLDERAGKGADEDEDGERRGSSRRRGKSRAEKSAARAEAEARDKREIAELRAQNSSLTGRLDALEGRQSESDKREVETNLANIEAAIANVRARKAREIAALGSGEGNANALEELDEALYGLREQHRDLKRLKEKGGGEKRANADDRGGDRGGGDGRITPAEGTKITEFLDSEPWIDTAGGDEDSRVALAIDRKMSKEGWRPSRTGWEDEFRKRLQQELPHRFSDDEDDDPRPQRRRSAPTGGRGREGGASRRTVFLDAERKEILAQGNHEPGSPSYKRILEAWHKVDEEAARKR